MSAPTIIVVIRGGCVYDAVSDQPVDLLVIDKDQVHDDSPEIPTLGRADFDFREVHRQPATVAAVLRFLKGVLK